MRISAFDSKPPQASTTDLQPDLVLRTVRLHLDAAHHVAVVDQRVRAHAVTDLDAVLLGELEVLIDQARPAAPGLHREPAPELEPAFDLVGLPAPDRREPHALALQPAHAVARAVDETLAQLAVGAVVRDAEHVVEELVGRVSAEVALRDLVRREVGHDRLEVVDAVIDAAERAGGEARVAAHQLLRRALDHQHARAALARRERRAERGIAGADHDHVPLLSRHLIPPVRAAPPCPARADWYLISFERVTGRVKCKPSDGDHHDQMQMDRAYRAAARRARRRAGRWTVVPSKPIRLVLPYAPGGATDFIGRTVAQHLGEVIGQQVVAENRTGSGGIPGTDYVVRSAPDGYTLVLMDPALVINPSLLASLPFDLFKDLKIVSRVSSAALVLVASPHLPVKTFAEFLAHGKANPGKLNFASAGIGTTPHLAGELFKQRAGVDAVHVPYRGIGQSYTDMMSGKISFAFSSFAGAQPFTADNRVRPLATTGLKRSTGSYADLPTLDEAGPERLRGRAVVRDPGAGGGAGGCARQAQRRAGQDAAARPELKAAFAKIGAEPVPTTQQDGAAFLKTEHEKWKKVIADGNIKEN